MSAHKNSINLSHLGARYGAEWRELLPQAFVIYSIIKVLHVQINTLQINKTKLVPSYKEYSSTEL